MHQNGTGQGFHQAAQFCEMWSWRRERRAIGERRDERGLREGESHLTERDILTRPSLGWSRFEEMKRQKFPKSLPKSKLRFWNTSFIRLDIFSSENLALLGSYLLTRNSKCNVGWTRDFTFFIGLCDCRRSRFWDFWQRAKRVSISACKKVMQPEWVCKFWP